MQNEFEEQLRRIKERVAQLKEGDELTFNNTGIATMFGKPTTFLRLDEEGGKPRLDKEGCPILRVKTAGDEESTVSSLWLYI